MKKRVNPGRLHRYKKWGNLEVPDAMLESWIRKLVRSDRIEYLLQLWRLDWAFNHTASRKDQSTAKSQIKAPEFSGKFLEQVLSDDRRAAFFIKRIARLWGQELSLYSDIKRWFVDARSEILHLIEEAQARKFRKVLNYEFKLSKPPFRLIEELKSLRELDIQANKAATPVREGDLVAQCGDYQWVLLDRAGCELEAEAMDHCGNAGDQTPWHRILSLRSRSKTKKEIPHLTFIISLWSEKPPRGWLGEMKGRSNSKPTEKYHEAITALLKSGHILFMIGGGYKPQNNFEITDLSPALRKEVHAAQPHVTDGPYHLYSITPDEHKPLFLAKLFAEAQGCDPTKVKAADKTLELTPDGKSIKFLSYSEEQFFHMIRNKSGISALTDLWERYVKNGMDSYDPPEMHKGDLGNYLSEIRTTHPEVASAWKRWSDSGDEEAEETLKRSWYDGWQFGTEVVAIKLLETGLEKIGVTWDRPKGMIYVYEPIEGFLDRCNSALYNRQYIDELGMIDDHDGEYLETDFWPRGGFDSEFDFEGAVESLRDQMPRVFTPKPAVSCSCGRKFFTIPKKARTVVDKDEPKKSGKYFECDGCKSTVFAPKHGFLKSKNPGKHKN